MKEEEIRVLADNLWFEYAVNRDGWLTTMDFKHFYKAINKAITEVLPTKEIKPVSGKEVLEFIESNYAEHLKLYLKCNLTHNWIILRCPENYTKQGVVIETDLVANLKLDENINSFLRKNVGVKEIIMVHGIYWCLVF